MSPQSPRIDLAFTPAVKAVQAERGSRQGYENLAARRDWPGTITEELTGFIAERDSFYLATASAEGRPYIQHRGGPPGFLKVLDERQLAFADYSGNRQYITVGNLSENTQAFIFLMDYAQRRRIKVWGRAKVVVGDEALAAQVADPEYPATPEHVIVFEVEAWDVNCKQHITPRYTAQALSTARPV